MTLTIICSSRESIATMLSKYVLRERKGSVRGRRAKPDPPWMDASEARELSLLTRRFSAARGCDAAAVKKVCAIWLHLHRRRASAGSYFETSSRKSLSSVCLARPLHTCKDQEKKTKQVTPTSLTWPVSQPWRRWRTCNCNYMRCLASVPLVIRVFSRRTLCCVYGGRRCSGTLLLWGVVLSV